MRAAADDMMAGGSALDYIAGASGGFALLALVAATNIAKSTPIVQLAPPRRRHGRAYGAVASAGRVIVKATS